jgi:hypothetical protein
MGQSGVSLLISPLVVQVKARENDKQSVLLVLLYQTWGSSFLEAVTPFLAALERV